jgi:hypothetical protein
VKMIRPPSSSSTSAPACESEVRTTLRR